MAYDGAVLVTFESIGQAATDCRTMNNELSQQLGDLKNYLAPMVSVWAGQAAENYNALQAKWDRAAEDLSQILTQIETSLNTARDNYQATENANAGIWGG